MIARNSPNIKNASNEVSFRSIRMLEERFAERRGRKIWVPDWGRVYQHSEEKDLDVLLMGSFFERLFQPEFWPDQEFSLFCLSPKVKDCLVELFGMDPETIGHLSRYDLFPAKETERESYAFNGKTHLYYAGRLSPQKNIEFIILTTFYLQMLFSPEIQLSLFGHFDNEYHKDILGCHFHDYEKKITTLIEGLPWPGAKPLIITGLDEKEWPKKIPARGLFFSASNLISEDFSVTAAQLQEYGRALLLPQWGGLADVRGENVRHYSADYIGHSHLSLKEIKERAKNFAMAALSKTSPELFRTLPAEKAVSFIPSRKLCREALQELYLKNTQKWGGDLSFLQDRNLPAFVASEAGQAFFKECRRLFSF